MKNKILLWGTYESDLPRLKILIDGIKSNNFELEIINNDVWKDYTDKSQIKGLLNKLKILTSLIFAYIKLLYKYIVSEKNDMILVSYPAILDIFILLPFAKLRGEKIIWDVFIPLYECVIEDRTLFPPKSFAARLIYILEYTAAKMVDYMFLDTKAHARYFEKQYHLPENSVGFVFVGAEDCFFSNNLNNINKFEHDFFEVLFYGKYIPLQGIETIIKAAKLIQEKDKSIRFKIVGQGQESEKIDNLVKSIQPDNIEMIKWMEYPDLLRAIKNADLCLGIFGTTQKTQNVIPNKLFQALAMNKPTITLDTPAIRELYEYDNFDNIILIKDSNEDSLEEAIMNFKNNPQDRKESLKLDYKLVGEQFRDFVLNRFKS